jgi:hypothetical protein
VNIKTVREHMKEWARFAPDDAPNFAARFHDFLDSNRSALNEMDLIARARAEVGSPTAAVHILDNGVYPILYQASVGDHLPIPIVIVGRKWNTP